MPVQTKPAATEPLAVDTKTAATLLNSTDASLEKDRAVGHMGVPYIRAGRRVIYRLADLRAWLEANRVTPSSQCASAVVVLPKGDQ
jgi:hypothetical protein